MTRSQSTPQDPCLTLSPPCRKVLITLLEYASEDYAPEFADLFTPTRLRSLLKRVEGMGKTEALLPLSDKGDLLALGLIAQVQMNGVALRLAGPLTPQERQVETQLMEYLLFIGVQANLLLHLHGTSINAEAARLLGEDEAEQLAQIRAKLTAARQASHGKEAQA